MCSPSELVHLPPLPRLPPPLRCLHRLRSAQSRPAANGASPGWPAAAATCPLRQTEGGYMAQASRAVWAAIPPWQRQDFIHISSWHSRAIFVKTLAESQGLLRRFSNLPMAGSSWYLRTVHLTLDCCHGALQWHFDWWDNVPQWWLGRKFSILYCMNSSWEQSSILWSLNTKI